jgi:hypothetical protein
MNAYTGRIAAAAALFATPVLIALGAAGYAHADSAVTNNGPSVSHPAFPNQTNTPQPGTAIHHHHQNHHAK